MATVGNEVIGEPSDYGEQDEETGEWTLTLPEEIDDQKVFRQGDLIVSEALVPVTDDATAEFKPGEVDEAIEWLIFNRWDGVTEWAGIRRAVSEALATPQKARRARK